MEQKIIRQILCSFSDTKNYIDQINKIKSSFDIIDNRIFVFINEKNLKDMFLTFTINKNKKHFKKATISTISVHRKKNTNTLYTLNAMNKLIQDENNGVLDKDFIISWELYKNSLILNNEIGVRIIPIRLFNLIKL